MLETYSETCAKRNSQKFRLSVLQKPARYSVGRGLVEFESVLQHADARISWISRLMRIRYGP